jgi:hypothetical protein
MLTGGGADKGSETAIYTCVCVCVYYMYIGYIYICMCVCVVCVVCVCVCVCVCVASQYKLQNTAVGGLERRNMTSEEFQVK